MAVPSNKTGNTADVIVIGGGLHGLSAALHLSMQGVDVTVLEKDYCGRHASGVNAGGVRRLGRALPEVPLSVAAAELWQNIEQLVGDDCGFESTCQIKVAETEADLRKLQHRSKELQDLGFDHEEIIDRKTLRKLLPAVNPECVGGMVVHGDGHANPFRTVQAFRHRASSLGAQIYEGAQVTETDRRHGVWVVRTANGNRHEAPVVINSAGAWAGRFADQMGDRVSLRPAALMLMITARLPAFIDVVVGATGRTLSFKQFENGTVMIGGGFEGQANLETNQTTLDFAGLATSARSAIAIFPIMQKARIVRQWAGIEGMMADGIPVLGPSQSEGLFHSFGYSAHGFQLSPICGKIVSDLVLTGSTDLPIAAFRADRFNT
ncbi:MAG: NAD(P)/FAD-dependent oxidoreductase [Rhizobiaceae bacterium]